MSKRKRSKLGTEVFEAGEVLTLESPRGKKFKGRRKRETHKTAYYD